MCLLDKSKIYGGEPRHRILDRPSVLCQATLAALALAVNLLAVHGIPLRHEGAVQALVGTCQQSAK